MRVFMITAAVASVASLAACSEKVSNNGTSFSCADGGACPSGFTCENAYCVPGDGGPGVDANVSSACSTAVTSGAQHSCALLGNGSVSCWGRNDHGQVGNDMIDANKPVTVAGLGSASAIGAGLLHTCAVVSGAVWCWGANSAGQLGNNSTADSATPVQAIGVTNAMSVVGGDSHTCALLVDGTVMCWGKNTVGQLGLPATTGVTPPTAASPAIGTGSDGSVVSLAAAANTTCATFSTKAVRCWGANDSGQFGTTVPTTTSTPTSVPGVTNALVVAMGRKSACAVDGSGGVSCWGDNAVGELGDGTGSSGAARHVALPVASSTTISAGEASTCVRDTTGTMWCWGNDHDGQLGDGNNATNDFAPVRSELTNVVAIAAGARHTCVRHADGSVQCVGNDERGQLGDGLRTSETVPTPIPSLGSGVLSISAGGQHTCAVRADASIVCWGKNNTGAIGDGTTIDRDTPTAIGVSASQVSAGYLHTCALTAAGALCWGDNTYGELGDASTNSSTVPVAVAGFGIVGKTPVDLAAGGNHTCVAFSNEVQCWGTNVDGELATDNTNPSTDAAEQSGATFSQISAGNDNTCGVYNTDAFCWGSGTLGQDGNQASGNEDNYVQVGNLQGSQLAVGVGSDFACALNGSGAVSCWGTNMNGQIGDGDGDPGRNMGFPVSLGSAASSLYVGPAMSCARLVDNSLWCWGVGTDGQFVDYNEHDAPFQELPATSSTYDIAIGLEHICMLQGGAVSCWGGDTHGELGDGVPNPPTPRTVALTCPAM